jgi:hypothetical protein
MSLARRVSFTLAVVATAVGLALTIWVSGGFFLLAFLAFALAVFTAPYELVRGADTEGSAGPVGWGDGGDC